MEYAELAKRLPAISVNPGMATRVDVACMAAELMERNNLLYRIGMEANNRELDALRREAREKTKDNGI